MWKGKKEKGGGSGRALITTKYKSRVPLYCGKWRAWESAHEIPSLMGTHHRERHCRGIEVPAPTNGPNTECWWSSHNRSEKCGAASRQAPLPLSHPHPRASLSASFPLLIFLLFYTRTHLSFLLLKFDVSILIKF